MLQIKIKKNFQGSLLPTKKNKLDAGIDCFANSFNETEDYVEYGLGFSIEIPSGYCGLVFPRSSISNYDILLSNSVGIIDSGYRGEVKARFIRTGNKIYEIGDKICQLILYKYPDIELVEVGELDMQNDRKGGYGSTGK